MSAMSAIAADYRDERRRNPYMSATQAYRLAVWRATAPKKNDGDEWEAGGLTLRISVYPDNEPFDGDDVPEFLDHATPDTVLNPSYRGDDRRPGARNAYALVPLMRLTEQTAWYRSQGASRSVARETATAEIVDHVKRWTWDYGITPYGVVVTASRGGIELGSASLWGVDFSDDFDEQCRYLADVASDLEPEAIADARDAMARICLGGAS